MCDNPELDSTEQSSTGRAQSDRPEDPLFPLMPQVLEALRNKALEKREGARSRSTDGDEEGDLSTDEYTLLIESICGATDDSQPVEQYNGSLGVNQAFVNNNQRPVGQIQWNTNLASIYTNPGNVSGARWCTGTMISNDLFLTAGHCFDQTGGGWQRPRTNGTSNIIPVSEIATNMHVNFNYQVDSAGNPRTEVSFPIVAMLEYRLGGLDFAIVRLGGNPGATWGTTPIATNDANAGDMLCIIGHPAGQRKRIEAGPAIAPSGSQIRYDDIDTLGGNSGSGVLRASDGRIVGVHTNGGCGPNDPNPGTGFNFGMRIEAVIAASPILQGLTAPKLKVADDVGPKLKFLDDGGGPKFKVVDDVGPKLKFKDDVGPKLKVLDDPLKSKFRDDGPPKFKLIDDGGKSPFADGGRPPFDPGRPPFARPFALATPHQSMAWQGQGGSQQGNEASQAYGAALQQLAEAIQQQQMILAELGQQYQQLAAEYQQAMGAQGGGF